MFEKAKEKYKNTEYKMLIAKVIDKYNFCKDKKKNNNRKNFKRRKNKKLCFLFWKRRSR